MKLTSEQAEKAIQHLGNGARIREACDMVHASWRDFSSTWIAGRNDSEAGKVSQDATFFREARAARARHIATRRAEAAAVAGSRESSDLIAYVRELEAEQEPLTDDDGVTGPTAVVLFAEHPDPRVREAAGRALDAADELLRALTASTREVAVS
ncbi:MAG: hypothetical protein ACXW0R_08810 [Gaiellaceae bacterium]